MLQDQNKVTLESHVYTVLGTKCTTLDSLSIYPSLSFRRVDNESLLKLCRSRVAPASTMYINVLIQRSLFLAGF